MENYKGLYYKETKELKYYEGGAHFPYKVLFKILLDLGGKILNDEYNNHPINYNNKYLNNDTNNDISSLLHKMKENKTIHKTRNIEQLNYMNNPNTLNQYSSLNFNEKEYSKKKFISRNENNINNGQIYYNKKNYSTTSNLNRQKNNKDNHLLHILLNKKQKEKEKHYEERGGGENNNDNRASYFLYFYKYNHYRNPSLHSNNYENNKQTKINNNENITENRKDNYQAFLKNKIHLIYNYNDFNPVENNRKNNESRDNKEIINKNKDIKSSLYGKPIEKSYLSYFDNIKRKSRNINNNNIEYKTSIENNKNDSNRNYTKKHINNYLFKTGDNKIKQEKNNDIYMNNLNNAVKWKYIEVNKNDMLKKKYKKKKINQLCCFNFNNGKAKSGNNIFAKNINKLNIVNNKNID